MVSRGGGGHPACRHAVGVISITDITQNQGTGSTEASITRFYFSANTTLDTADTPLGGRVVVSLAAGASSSGTTSVTIPAGTTTGGHYLLAVADADGTVDETLESSNRSFRSIAVGSELRVSALTAPASAGGLGRCCRRRLQRADAGSLSTPPIGCAARSVDISSARRPCRWRGLEHRFHWTRLETDDDPA